MNTKEINNYLNKYLRHNCFGGTYPSNYVPEFKERPIGIIINTDIKEKNGIHWVAVILLKNGKGEYFDSFGKKPNKNILKYLRNNCKKEIIYNTKCIQDCIFHPFLNNY